MLIDHQDDDQLRELADIRELFDNGWFDSYQNRDPYPARPDKPVMPRPGSKASDFAEYAKLLAEWEIGSEEYNQRLKEWREKEQRLVQRFQNDAARYHDMVGHPKWEKVYSFAWRHGHAEGLHEVAFWLDEAVALVK